MHYIHEILFSPEGKTLEFKRDLSSLPPILKTLVAFANTAGGILVIGNEDGGNVAGIEDIFHAEEKLANAIADNIHPPLMPEIETISVNDKALLLVRVSYWRGPFYIKNKGPEEGVYIRLGSTNRQAGPELLAEMKRSQSNISFDQMPCPDVDVEGLDMKRVNEAFSKRKIDKNKLESLGLLVPYAGKMVCSNGGLLLFGKDHLREKYFPNSTVRCARFQGTEKVNFIDQFDTEGTLIEAMKEVTHFIRRNTRMAAKIESIQRVDIPEYSPLALREVLTNALVHADYSIKGMCPRVMIFSDRLEIESPGMLPFGYTLKDFENGVSHIRNRVIAKVFRELGLMEEWGTGYRRITEASMSEGYLNPVWQEIGTTIRVTFLPHSVTHEEIILEENELSFRQERILQLCQRKGPLTAKEIYKELGEKISERTLRKDLLELKNMGAVKTRGNGPQTMWMAKKN